MVNRAKLAYAAVTPPIPTASFDSNVATLSGVLSKLNSVVGNNQDKVHDGTHRGYVAVSVIGALLIFVAVVAAAAAALRSRRALLGASWLVWLSALVTWLLAGVTYVIYLISGDACLGLDWVLSAPATTGMTGYAPCLDPTYVMLKSSSALYPLWLGINATNAALAACSASGPVGAGAVCNPVMGVPGRPGLYMPTPAAVPCPAPNVRIGTGVFAATYNATTCPALAGTVQLAALGAVADSVAVLWAGMPVVAQLINCTNVFNSLYVTQNACPSFFGGAKMLYRGMLVAALAQIVTLVATIASYRLYAVAEAAGTVIAATVVDDVTPADVESQHGGDAAPAAAAEDAAVKGEEAPAAPKAA